MQQVRCSFCGAGIITVVNTYFYSIYTPGTILSILCILIHLFPKTTLGSKHYNYSHSMYEKTEKDNDVAVLGRNNTSCDCCVFAQVLYGY